MLFGELMRRELASLHGTDYQRELSDILDISGFSTLSEVTSRPVV